MNYARGDIDPEFATKYRLPIPQHAPFAISYTFESKPHHCLPDAVGMLLLSLSSRFRTAASLNGASIAQEGYHDDHEMLWASPLGRDLQNIAHYVEGYQPPEDITLTVTRVARTLFGDTLNDYGYRLPLKFHRTPLGIMMFEAFVMRLPGLSTHPDVFSTTRRLPGIYRTFSARSGVYHTATGRLPCNQAFSIRLAFFALPKRFFKLVPDTVDLVATCSSF